MLEMSSKSGRNLKEEDDDEWLFESILAFLSSPIWSNPIQHFIEANCSIFSPNDSWSGGALLDDDNEDDLEKVPIELIDIHLKYKDLVDTLIKTFLHDIGVSYSQFVKACKRTSTLNENSAYLELFEQIWAAENFRMFKSQMIRKNIELELQALVLLQYQLGLIKSGSGEVASRSADDEIMALVIKKSIDEYDSLMNSRKSKNPDLPIQKPQDLEIAKKLVKSDELVDTLKSELENQEHLNNKILKEGLRNPTSDRPVSARKTKLEDQFDNMKLRENSFIKSKPKMYDVDDDDVVSGNKQPSKAVSDIAQTVLAQSGGNLSQSEIEKRAEFMRKQRDILTERKRIERQKQLDELVQESKQNGDLARPMSSRAARSVLSGADPSDIQQSISTSRSEEERKKIEARKALAETLRKEVVNNSRKN